MSRREWMACVGATLGLLAAHRAPAWLIASNRWPALVLHEPATARYVYRLLVVPLPFVGAILACALVNFAEVHGVASPQRRRRRPLPPYPFDPRKTQLVIGETHHQDGSPSEQPGWLILPEKGMYTGILITGATGSAKTSAAQYPFTAQLIHLHAGDAARKMGGLIIDAKGKYADFVLDQCAHAGRLADYYEVSLTSGVRWNIVGRPDLNAAALGGHIADMIENVQGTSLADPFWHQEAKDLASQVIRVLRLAAGREPTMASLSRAATSYETYESFVAKLRNEHVAAQLIANLRTKIWLCAEDNFTARQAADLCGEIERKKVSRSRNENSRRSAFSFLDGDVIAADPGSVGEGITVSLRREHLFMPRAFTSLKVNQAIVKAFDGVRVLEPWVVYLKPMHEN